METSFGDTLKRVRMEKKITIREVSRYIKKSIGYVSDIEHNRKLPPDLETVRKMEEFLGISAGALVNVAARVTGYSNQIEITMEEKKEEDGE